jgi:hypothetical protein
MTTKHFNYFEDYKNLILECPKCQWKGTFEQGSVEYYADLMDCACPECDVFVSPMLAVVLFPTLEELRANADRPGVREWVQGIDGSFDRFESQKLQGPEQLPEIDSDSFKLVWDFEADKPSGDGRTLLKHGDVVIFSEPARDQDYPRFGQIAEMLKAKYGERIKDVEPTKRSATYLYGDPRKGEGFVESVRVQAFGATIVEPDPGDDFVCGRPIADFMRELAAEDDSPATEAETVLEVKHGKWGSRQTEASQQRPRTMRPVPGVPGVAWERTEEGTSLIIEPNSEFDKFPREQQSDIMDRLLKCCAAPQHYLRTTAMRDEFANNPAKPTGDAKADMNQRQSGENDFQYGPELPDIDAVEFSFAFDYSDDRSKYFVLYGKRVILSGPAADDPEDCITDNARGGQFIEIAKKLKKQYGARLVDLVPTKKAANRLMDIWGWAIKMDRGRKLVQEPQGTLWKQMTHTT